MQTLNLNCFGLQITWNGTDRGGAAIISTMKEEDTAQNEQFNAGVDALESLVLAHFCAGIDVASPAYLQGIETAYEQLGNHIDDSRRDNSRLPSVDGLSYQWLLPTQTESGTRYLTIEGDEIDLSDLMFNSAEDAIKGIENEAWGWTPEDAEKFVLVRVEKHLIKNPFSKAAAPFQQGTKTPQRLRFAVHLEGGLVQDIFCNDTKGFECTFSIFEYDSQEGDDEMSFITQPNGKKASAFIVHHGISENPGINLDEIFITDAE